MIADLIKDKRLYIAVILIILAILPSVYFYNQYKKTQKILDTLPKSVDETRKLLDSIGKLIQLPNDEEPMIATVSDKEKLKNQTFFQTAENGDKVLIYTKLKKAILYRPSENRIIDVAIVNIKDSTDASQSAKLSETSYSSSSAAIESITSTQTPTPSISPTITENKTQ
jgi:hypothetical protein